MLFLEKIDELYGVEKQSFSITDKNKKFNIFIPIKISTSGTLVPFLVRKGNKSQLLVVSGKQKVYLSDIDIIRTILAMENDDITWFLRQFVLLYQGKGTNVKLYIQEDVFECLGIIAYPEKKELCLFSDTVIDYSVFCCLLNFVFAKDRCWEDLSGTDNFSKKTICKYIAMIDLYANDGEYSKFFLKSIGYPVDIEEQSLQEDNRIQKAFKNIKNIEKFDISKYM